MDALPSVRRPTCERGGLRDAEDDRLGVKSWRMDVAPTHRTANPVTDLEARVLECVRDPGQGSPAQKVARALTPGVILFYEAHHYSGLRRVREGHDWLRRR
jgi:hypothetical protein